MNKDLYYVISVLDEMRDEWYQGPKTYKMKQDQFMHISYNKWAIDEVRLYLMEHQDMHPITALEELRYYTYEKSCTTESADMNYICNILCDMIVSVLDVLYGMI